MMKQKTFMMLKPDAFTNQYEEILKDLKAHGLKIEKQVKLEVDMDVMKTLLDHYKGVIDPWIKRLISRENYLIPFTMMDLITLCQ